MNQWYRYWPFVIVTGLAYFFFFNLHFSSRLVSDSTSSGSSHAIHINLQKLKPTVDPATEIEPALPVADTALTQVAETPTVTPVAESQTDSREITDDPVFKPEAYDEADHQPKTQEKNQTEPMLSEKALQGSVEANAPSPRQDEIQKAMNSESVEKLQTVNKKQNATHRIDSVESNQGNEMNDLDSTKHDEPQNLSTEEHFTQAVIIGVHKPAYPRMAILRNQSGTVVVEMWVDKTGKSSDIQLVESSGHRLLDESVVDFVSHEKFRPARKGDRPVGSRQQFTFVFHLE
ncbi:MAG: energy transducer TonB [Pseudomonadales bacterium]|nr:energy transducer TonB [Pseudomonadales bacterium]